MASGTPTPEEVERVILALYSGQNVTEANAWLMAFVASPVRACSHVGTFCARRAPAFTPPICGLHHFSCSTSAGRKVLVICCVSKRARRVLALKPVYVSYPFLTWQAAWEISINMINRYSTLIYCACLLPSKHLQRLYHAKPPRTTFDVIF